MNPKEIDVRILKIAAFFHAFGWIFIIIYLLVINPALGLKKVEDLDNPDILLKVIHDSPVVLGMPTLDALLGISLIMMSLSIYNLMPARDYLNKLQLVTGYTAGIFFIYATFSRLLALPHLAEVYLANPGPARLSHEVVNSLQYGISFFINSILGLWLVLTSLIFIRRNLFNRIFNWIGMGVGILNLFVSLFQPVAGLLFIYLLIRCLLVSGQNKKAFLESTN